MKDESRLFHETLQVRLSDKEYVKRLRQNIKFHQERQVELFARYTEYLSTFDPAKSPIEMASIMRLMSDNAAMLSAFCKDFDTVIAIKETSEHQAEQAKKKLVVYNALFEGK